ncbi:hypothetical protein ZIOFF_036429 [Zingiber officinale]|uniref:Reverse transcriptase Ty1/copia-type domain-containing protein n=1 Tax=Zingiber officinale TaxID=94328 RepID=A0A8J5L814_ZINOF|nr:hypothetical protein ZIOFF_036429 [Zingiber officinale]
MHEEYNALLRNQTWTLVPPSPDQNLMGNRWVFRIKRNSDCSINRGGLYGAMCSAEFSDHMCRLYKALYGLKQAPRVGIWSFALSWSDASSIDVIVCKLHAKFVIKNLGVLSLFYGVEVHPASNGLLLS